jgi:hypothetical protein
MKERIFLRGKRSIPVPGCSEPGVAGYLGLSTWVEGEEAMVEIRVPKWVWEEI